MNFERDSHKDAGKAASNGSPGESYPNSPAVMKLVDGTLIEVCHWFYDNNGRICVYFDERSGGIDARILDDEVSLILESRAAALRTLNMTQEELREEVENHV